MSKTLVFGSLTVREAPGLPDAFTIDAISPGLVLVHGPNGAGKSTTSRIIQRLLWADAKQHLRCRAEATFTVDGVLYSAQRDRDDLTVRRDGTPVSSLDLPPWSDHDRYLLSLHDLIIPASGSDEFARHIASLSQGGFRFDDAARALGAREKPRTGAGIPRETERYRQARRDRRKAEDEQQRANASRTELERAAAQLEAGEVAQQRIDALSRAIARANAAAQHETALVELSTFPHGMDRVQGDAIDALARLERERRDTLTEIASEEQLARTAAETASAAFADSPPADDVRERLRLLADEWQQAERETSVATVELEKARGALRVRRDVIGDLVDENTLARLVGDSLHELEQFTVDESSWQVSLDGANDEVTRLTNEQRDFETTPLPTGDPALLRSGMLLLARWLREGAVSDTSNAPTADEAPSSALIRSILVLVAAVAAVASIMLGMQQHPAWYGAALFALVCTAVGVTRTGPPKRAPASPDPRPTRRAEFEALRLPVAPTEWTDAAVATTVERIAEAIADVHSHSQLRTRTRERLAEQLRVATLRLDQLTARSDEFTKRRATLLDAIGVKGDWSLARLTWLGERMREWVEAHTEYAKRDATHACATQRLAELDARTREALQSAGRTIDAVAVALDAGRLTAACNDLDRRSRAYVDARDREQQAQMRLSGLRHALSRRDGEIRDLFARNGCEDGDVSSLEARCALHPAYMSARGRESDARIKLAERDDDLRGNAAADPSLMSDDLPTLVMRLEQATARAADVGPLRQRCEELRRNVLNAAESHDLEKALADEESTTQALADCYLQDVHDLVAYAITREVQQETRDAERPAVFARAQALFERFTGARYRLELSDDSATPAFAAFDRQTHVRHPLDELSTGTKVQLLLAVRLAFVETLEGELRLPLLMDEVLGTSDPVRAQAIMEAVAALVRDGRQVFYFTAQDEERARWQRYLAGCDIQFCDVNLAHVRRLPGRSDLVALDEIFAESAVPSPDGSSYLEYGQRLGVPPITAGGGTADGTHVWYLAADTAEVHECLLRGITHWGPLRECPEALLGPVTTARARMAVVAEAVKALHEESRIGRGTPITADCLRDSNAVSDAFMERAVTLAEQCGGDGATMVSRLRAGALLRFRADAIDRLEDYFRETGHIVDEAPRPPLLVKTAVRSAFLRGGFTGEAADAAMETLYERISAFHT